MATWMICRPRQAVCVISLCVCALFSGCVGATRLPTRAISPAGTNIPQKEINLGFLQVGSTHREEVLNQLAPVATSYSNSQLFWGRWRESTWGYWWVVGWPCNNCMAGDAGRKWHIKNLLISFDQNGVVSGRDAITDEKLLWQTLHTRMVEMPPPPLDLSQPIRVSFTTTNPSNVLLTKDYSVFETAPDKGKPTVEISVNNLVRFSHSTSVNKNYPLGVTCHAFEFSQKTVYGKKIKFCAEADQVGILFQYLHQVGPPSMKWQ